MSRPALNISHPDFKQIYSYEIGAWWTAYSYISKRIRKDLMIKIVNIAFSKETDNGRANRKRFIKILAEHVDLYEDEGEIKLIELLR